MTDRELLEYAAKAAGYKLTEINAGINGYFQIVEKDGTRIHGHHLPAWNPLTDDGDALRLAVKLNLSADFFDDEIRVGYTPNDNECDQVVEPVGTDPYAATRRAIVRAAAEIGRKMK